MRLPLDVPCVLSADRAAPGVDRVAVLLVDRGFSGESRSTNQFSNLLEDVYHAAVARHVSQDGRYFF